MLGCPALPLQNTDGVFTSVSQLQDAIARYIREHNKTPKPFVWTKTAEAILAKLDRLPVPSE